MGLLENAPNEHVSYKYAGGPVISSDEDLVRFGHALNGGVLTLTKTIAETYRLQLPLDLPRFEDKTSPPIGAIQGLVFRLGKDAAGRVYAWHSGSVKGTTSEFLNFYADDVVVALHFNYGAGPVDTVAACGATAAATPSAATPSAAAHDAFSPRLVNTSTIPANGDLNPDGVAFVPDGFPARGSIAAGDVLVGNFNAVANNSQGTGTTIVQFAPSGDLAPPGTAATFFTSTLPGLSAAPGRTSSCPMS